MGYISPISTKYSISFCIIIVYFVSCKNVKLLSTNIKEKSVKIVFKLEYKKLAKHPPSAGFLSPSGETARSTPHSFKNFRRVMRIPNMYLVLKLDNGKVVSIANGPLAYPEILFGGGQIEQRINCRNYIYI